MVSRRVGVPKSLPVLTDEEVTEQMKAEFAPPAEIEAELASRAALQAEVQQAYDGTRTGTFVREARTSTDAEGNVTSATYTLPAKE